jgi:hypothetical protein
MKVALLRIVLATLFVIATFQTSQAQMPSGGPWLGKLDDSCKEWGVALKNADKSDAALKTTIAAANRKLLQQLSAVDIPFSDENVLGGVARRLERCLAREANDPHVLGGARQATSVTAKTPPMYAEDDPNSRKQSTRPGGTRDFFRIDPNSSTITVSLGATVATGSAAPAAAGPGAPAAAGPGAPAATKVPTVAALQAFGKQWGDYCLTKGSSCCTAPERVSGYREYCTGNDTCKLSAKICQTVLACDSKQLECKKKTNNSAKCAEDYARCHDGALKISG